MRLACCLSESDVESEVVGGKFGEGRRSSSAQRGSRTSLAALAMSL